MRKLFSKPHERQKGSFDASEIEIIGVGCGGTNIVNYMQTHGFKDFPLAVCDMDASVIEHSKVREKLLFGMDGLGAGNNPELGNSEAEKKMMDIRSIIKESFICCCVFRRRMRYRSIPCRRSGNQEAWHQNHWGGHFAI